MAVTRDHIGPGTPVGANLVDNGATFRVWAPSARAVYICYDGQWCDDGQPDPANLLAKDERGYWAGYLQGIGDGTRYKFYVVGAGSSGYKRDPYARELTDDAPHPFCVVRDPSAYPWHDDGFTPPAFNDLVIYQLHVGTFYIQSPQRRGKYLDVLDKLDYLVDLGVRAVQPLPVVEFPTEFSMGYNGTDLFSPENHYAVHDPAQLAHYLSTANSLLRRRGKAPLALADLQGATDQLKALVDICHLYGLAVILDVVYNHAGGGFDDESIYFFDRAPTGDDNDSLYFTDQGWAGGLVFAYWKDEVRQFLIDNARYFAEEYHVDGFRYDEVSVIVSHSDQGWRFCQDLSGTVRYLKPSAVQIAEHWPVNPWVVKDAADGGAGFDSTWDDSLRDSVRGALGQATGGRDSYVNMAGIAAALRHVPGDFFDETWKGVEYLESHDEVYTGRSPRIAALCDPLDPRSWYARSRARTATGLLLTAPGIPMLFMGQELLEDRDWNDNVPDAEDSLLNWGDVDAGVKPLVDQLRLTRDLIALRRRHPALRGDRINVFYVNNYDRVLAYHRWLDGAGRDVVVVASLREETLYGYNLGFPLEGEWLEVFNSDAYENWVNPNVAGNGGSVAASGPPMHGLPSSASLVIPANSVLVFARDWGD